MSNLDEQYFDVIISKTENGIRKVPIADKVLPFYEVWFEDNQECMYILSIYRMENTSNTEIIMSIASMH